MEAITRSLCKSCRLRLKDIPQQRNFSTTSTRRTIPPESPAYIDVPRSHQATQLQPKRAKGLLPVPRELFPAKRPDKPSQQYFNGVIKNSQSHNVVPAEELSEYAQHRVRMAEVRKRHLRESLTGLHKRKQIVTANMKNRSRSKLNERVLLVAQPQREEDRLTASTTPASMYATKSSTPIADDLKAARAMHEAKKANYARVVAGKEETRLDALHSLYMNARTFITTEEQLNDAIMMEFDEKTFTDDTGDGTSMWNFGPPDTIKDMIAKAQPSRRTVGGMASALYSVGYDDAKKAILDRDQARMKQIAEKLSGGKI